MESSGSRLEGFYVGDYLMIAGSEFATFITNEVLGVKKILFFNLHPTVLFFYNLKNMMIAIGKIGRQEKCSCCLCCNVFFYQWTQ